MGGLRHGKCVQRVWGFTGAVAVLESTEVDLKNDEESAEAAISVLAARWQHAGDFFPSRLPSMARPASSRKIKGDRGGKMAGMELGAPKCHPRMQVKPTVTRPSLV